MGKRVFEVAKDLGVDHRHLLDKCDALDIKIRNYMSVLSDGDEKRLRDAYEVRRQVERAKPPGVVRRGRVSRESDSPDPAGRAQVENPEAEAPASIPPPRRAPLERGDLPQDPEAEPVAASIQKRVMPSHTLMASLSTSGLTYEQAWVHRFLTSVRTARRVGALVLLAGSTGTGKSAIVRASGRLLLGAAMGEIAVRPEWLQATDLLGYVDPIRSLFSPSEFVSQVREASRRHQGQVPGSGAIAPYLLLLDEMNLARIESYGADLLSMLECVGDFDSRVLQLYPSVQNQLWRDELASLPDPGATARGRELSAFFESAGGSERAHLLALPPNLVVTGTLNTDQHTSALSPKVLDRSFVLQSPPLSPAGVFDVPKVDPDQKPEPVTLPPEPADVGPGVWDGRPTVRQHLEDLLGIWNAFEMPPSRRMVRNARAYVAYAEYGDDAGQGGPNPLTADLLHLLLIPRIVLPPAQAKRLATKLDTWLEGRLDEQDPVRQEVRALLDRAESGAYGDVRGLR